MTWNTMVVMWRHSNGMGMCQVTWGLERIPLAWLYLIQYTLNQYLCFPKLWTRFQIQCDTQPNKYILDEL